MYALYALSAVLMVGYAAVFTLLAQMRSTFGFSEFELGAITASAFLAGFIAQLSLSRYADLGRGGDLLRVGLALALLGVGWMCVANSIEAWLAARMLLGFGAGCVRPAMRRYAFVLDPQNAGTALGRLAAWEMVGFLIGPVLASVAFEIAGIRAPFLLVGALLIGVIPFIWRVEVPGTEQPMQRAMLTLLRRPAMQSCLLIGVAFYLAVGVFDAIWALFVADLGASQLFIGISMSAFTLPMILIAPWAGGFAGRRHVLNLLTVTMSLAMLAMFCYGFIGSIYWLCVPLLVHAMVDAISMPATQLAVGYASGEQAIAAGQGLFGALGLLVAAAASMAGGALYQWLGPAGLWSVCAAFMALCIALASWRGRHCDWSFAAPVDAQLKSEA